MNREQVESFMDAVLSDDQVIRSLSSEERKRAFEAMKNNSQPHIAKEMQKFGLKGMFGISDEHREKVSVSMKASWAKRKAMAQEALDKKADNARELGLSYDY